MNTNLFNFWLSRLSRRDRIANLIRREISRGMQCIAVRGGSSLTALFTPRMSGRTYRQFDFIANSIINLHRIDADEGQMSNKVFSRENML